MQQILSSALNMRTEGWNIEVKISIIEIYNEEVKDLLAKRNPDTKLKIASLNDTNTIQGLCAFPLNASSVTEGVSQLNRIIDQANRLRSVAATNMNNCSSRSHVVYMIDLEGFHTDGSRLNGGLRLCDLAGSERLEKSGTISNVERLKETVCINKSLSSLADVFIAIHNKAAHIPFRNSKLTMILQVVL